MEKLLTTLVATVGIGLLANGCTGVQWTQPALNVPKFEQGHVYVCLDLPDKQLSGAHVAVDFWDRAIHQWRNVVAVDHGQPWLTTCTLWVHELKDAPEDAVDGRHLLARTSTLGGFEISMRKDWYERDTAGILMHEMGHAFGAQHVPGTLMDRTWHSHSFVCPDATTVAQVAGWNRISVEILSWCES
jgi:hypothetical protein